MTIKLRKHNEEAYEKIKEGFERSKKVAVVHSTGTGKSFLALRLLEDNIDKKAIYLAPSNAILHNIKKNIFESGMDMTDFPNLKRMTYQKLMRLSDEEIKELGVEIVILDEFHHCGAPEWGTGIDRLLKYHPHAQVLGLSATPIRYFDYSRDMAEELFGDNIASEMTLEEAINRGILPRAKYVSALYEFDEELEKMQQDIERIRNPEKKKQAQMMFENLAKQVNENTENLATMLAEHMEVKNGKYIVFCKNIEDMQEKMKQVQTMFGEVNSNIKTYAVSSKLTDNNRTLRNFEKDNDEDALKLMFAVDMLNEGYHINDLDGVIMMRPTYSPTIYAQQLGRALTVKDENGKEPLVIDLVNNFDSIKIIEELYERLRQYEPTGEHEKQQNPIGGLIIHDKTKEFREVARKISELSKRKIFSLQEKIETFERYLEAGNGEIDGQTIFEGKPIGQWAIQIRAQIKNQHKGINPTEEQLEKLDELGILERRFDSTIDEKIDALIEWQQKYPDIILERKKSNQPISEKTIEKLKELAQAEGVEFSEIEEKYKKIQSYNEYVRGRETNGKLTEEQWRRCKEGNLRGKFGFPTEIEKLAEKLKTDVKVISEITTNYGSIDNFIQMYRDGKLNDEEVMWYNNNFINNIIDMDYNPLSKNYINLLRAVFGMHRLNENNLMLFPSAKLEESLKILNSREMFVIQHRFGLIDGTYKTLEEVGKELSVTRDRVRQIEAKALRRLRHQSRIKHFQPVIISKLKENEYISDEEKDELTILEQDIWNSNLIFRHNSIDDVDFDKEKFDIIISIKEKINIRKEEAERASKKERLPQGVKNISIDEMNFSVRTYSCLRRGCISTLEELSNTTESDLMKIRNLGTKSMEEIVSKLDEYGIKLAENNEQESEEELHTGEGELETIQAFPIEQLEFSENATKVLLEVGITTIEELLNTSERMLEEKLKYRNSKLSFQTVEQVLKKRRELIQKYNFKEKRNFNANTSIIELEDIQRMDVYSLNYAGILTIRDLLKASEEELLQISGIKNSYRKKILKVRAKLANEINIDDTSTEMDEELLSSISDNDTKIDTKTIDIQELWLSKRVYSCLRRASINTLADLEGLTYQQLLGIRKLGERSAEEIISKAKKYGITFEGAEAIEEKERETEEPDYEKVHSGSEIKEIKKKKAELEAELKALEEQARQAKELLAKYNKLIGDDKVNADDETPDFKDE